MSIPKFLVVSAMLFIFPLSGYGAERATDCPMVDVKNNVLDASALATNSRISIRSGTTEYPLVLDLYQPKKRGCVKTEFARYSIEGGVPTVESIFYMRLRGRINVFSIVAWDINNRGDGTYGRLYQVYAYHFDENGVLVENKRVSRDDLMSGVDGYVEGRGSQFRYKTAADVKRYWRDKAK
ncbi:hypothetical protein [Burkholderia latens]|uniref:hypothetical protein n=1 Tax=Burkholderia latens TaxID=488446 RepID=UPI0012E386A2|nr:hypothetical protein [Burkholderia latens]